MTSLLTCNRAIIEDFLELEEKEREQDGLQKRLDRE